MAGRKIFLSDIKSGVYGDLIDFGNEFDAVETARELKNLVTEPSIENISAALAYREYILNVLLIERVPDKRQREFIVKAATDVMAHVALKVMFEYEEAHRTIRVEASRQAVAKKGEESQAITWSVIDEYIKSNGKRPKSKQLIALIAAKRLELGIKNVDLSAHQIQRHFANWRKAHQN